MPEDDPSLARPPHPLEARLQHRFCDPALLRRALVHRSFGAEHNERLEFLGDAVLGLAIASLLYEKRGAAAEGEMSRIRAHLVREERLHRIALALDLPPLLQLGEGEVKSGGRERPSILADAVEALLGALYLDGGFDCAARAVQRLFAPWLDGDQLTATARDAKTALQEYLQGRRLPLPQYRVLATHGAAHRQRFDVQCAVPGRQTCGSGTSRRAAEQAAAAAMLAQLSPRHDP